MSLPMYRAVPAETFYVVPFPSFPYAVRHVCRKVRTSTRAHNHAPRGRIIPGEVQRPTVVCDLPVYPQLPNRQITNTSHLSEIVRSAVVCELSSIHSSQIGRQQTPILDPTYSRVLASGGTGRLFLKEED